MNKKYELILSDYVWVWKGRRGDRLYRIKALRDFGDVKAGDRGGYIQSENNLRHAGNCWVYDNARVFYGSKVYDNAKICGWCHISGSSHIYGDSKVDNSVLVTGKSRIHGNATLKSSFVISSADVCGDTILSFNTTTWLLHLTCNYGVWDKLIIKTDRKGYLISHTLNSLEVEIRI